LENFRRIFVGALIASLQLADSVCFVWARNLRGYSWYSKARFDYSERLEMVPRSCYSERAPDLWRTRVLTRAAIIATHWLQPTRNCSHFPSGLFGSHCVTTSHSVATGCQGSRVKFANFARNANDSPCIAPPTGSSTTLSPRAVMVCLKCRRHERRGLPSSGLHMKRFIALSPPSSALGDSQW